MNQASKSDLRSGFSLIPTRDAASAARSLEQLLCRPDPAMFQGAIRRLHARFSVYAATSPAPLPAPDLIIAPEIRLQSETYLPIAEIAACFNRLYLSALAYPPILSSTPFYSAPSWADAFAALPPEFRFSANPARLLEALLNDRGLLAGFLFHSFLPRRFYGGVVRYPEQEALIRAWLATPPLPPSRQEKGQIGLRCLDAACGDGAGAYGLTRLLLGAGYAVEDFHVEGWTLEPLEVWAAAHVSFPHDQARQELLRSRAAPVFEQGAQGSLLFRQADLLELPADSPEFDLILCNGLLGGPIVSRREELQRIAGNLAALLRPGGLLLASDRFHGGWKRCRPQETLRMALQGCGLDVFEADGGIGGRRSGGCAD